MVYSLAIGEILNIAVDSRELYSSEQLRVTIKEEYEFQCNHMQKWKDWFIKTHANGYLNPIAALIGLRVKKTKCFRLCGCYNNNDASAFSIGMKGKTTVIVTGSLSFFANDVRGFYWNNYGTVDLTVKRIN